MTTELGQARPFDMRSNLQSLNYWRSSPEREAQRFYVAFCLLMSSVQDLILGQKERQSNNLNWSATCSYYSLVHAGHLLCFVALGDYPMQHSALRDVFSSLGQQRPPRASRRDGYPFDWLRRFGALTGPQVRQAVPDEIRSTSEFREMIAAYLEQVHVTNVEERLTRFGAVLAAAAPLRNDSNYEGLLIAHEYQHETMSSAFDELSSLMANAAESTLPFLIDAFNGFRVHYADTPEMQDAYETFLHVYVHDRIQNAIRRKLPGSMQLKGKLDDILVRIATRPTRASHEALEDQVSMAMFGGKARLMREFEDRIQDLARVMRA